MMMITAGGRDHELNTGMRTLEKIQAKAGKAAGELFANIGQADTKELVTMLCIAAGNDDKTLRDDLLDDEEWGYYRLNETVSELIARMTFAGSPELQEKQLEKSFGDDEKQKNEVRALLGLPQKALPSEATNGGNES